MVNDMKKKMLEEIEDMIRDYESLETKMGLDFNNEIYVLKLTLERLQKLEPSSPNLNKESQDAN